jgi:diaminopimelate decarboxylase
MGFSKVDKLRINYAMKVIKCCRTSVTERNGRWPRYSIHPRSSMGLHAGYEPEKIFYTPNGVSLEEIEEVNAMGVQINIDNLSILEQFGTKHPNVPVCIRINPHGRW